MKSQTNISPPTLWLKFFRWFCRPEYAEDLEGDILERFDERLEKHSRSKAKRLFILDVLRLLRPGLVKKIEGNQSLNNYGMFKNYFKTARRNLLRQKTYSIIKIGGFALGIAVCLLISLFIKDEFSYDQHIPDKENLFMAVRGYNENGNIEKYTWFPSPYANAILEDYPEVIQSGKMIFSEGFGAGNANIRKASEVTNYYEDGFAFASQSIMEIFNYPMVYGDAKNALKEPNSIILTKRKADLLFPGVNPVGEVVVIDDNTEAPYMIGGVMEDLPANSTVKFNYLRSLEDYRFWDGEDKSWGSNNYQVFVKLLPNTNLNELIPKLKYIDEKYLLPEYLEAGYSDAEEAIETMSTSLLPIADLHLKSADIGDPFEKSDIKIVRIFGLIALFILGLACINFINLSTAKSANRAKEVGLRKTIGSTKKHLITQFLTESILYSLLSFALAIGISSLLLPYFNQLAAKSLYLPWSSYWFVPILALGSLLIGLIAGLYPAFYLSSFRPAAVLKGKLSMGSKSSKLRNSLVVFQFTASIILIIGTFVVSKQMQYILNKKVGFNKDQVILVQSPYLLGDNLEAFKNALRTIPEVKSTSYTNYLPISGANQNGNVWWNDGRTKIDASISGQNWIIDHEYIETLGMNLIDGRNFSRELRTDSAAMIINETMAKQLGIADSPLGQRITNRSSNRLIYTVIGVVEDFHFQSLTAPVGALAMRLGKNYVTASVKLNTNNLSATTAQIQHIWDEMAPGQPFIYEFLDQRFGNMYSETIRTRNILTSFSMLAVIIACLGLFGLSVFMVEQRGKEISVRRALGAKMSQIIQMLGMNFMKPIFLALLLAIPVAWYIMKGWLNGFEYNTGLSVSLFAFAGLTALSIALITISFQSIKAGLTNPVDGLRNE